MLVTNKYVFYCLRTYFLHQFILLVYWLVFMSNEDDGSYHRWRWNMRSDNTINILSVRHYDTASQHPWKMENTRLWHSVKMIYHLSVWKYIMHSMCPYTGVLAWWCSNKYIFVASLHDEILVLHITTEHSAANVSWHLLSACKNKCHMIGKEVHI
jgi:hypothetical protein